MEEHPIPQNVTQFEFHLVGDMTLKQFGYLAAGLTSAYVTFIVGATRAPFLAYPLVVIFALAGVAFAFLPISERPLDHWVKAYINAIFSPTQRLFKSTALAVDNPYFDDRLALYLDNLPSIDGSPKLAPKLGSVSQLAPLTVPVVSTPVAAPVPQPPPVQVERPVQPAPVAPPPPQPISQPAPQMQPPPARPTQPLGDNDLTQVVEYAKEAQIIQTEIIEAEREMTSIKAQAAQPGNNPQEFSKNFQKVLTSLQNLNAQAAEVSKHLAELTESEPEDLQNPTKVVNIETKPSEKYLVLTTTPNIINGVVTDAAGNYLEGVIVVTHDKEGLPVRALKTNKLGQFLAATPLPNGTYTLTLEKDSLNFDVLQVELNGEVLPPVRISAKKGTA